MAEFSPAWLRWRERVDLDEYEQRWDNQAASGADVHGEADLIHSMARNLELAGPLSILDAGCGMGRVGIELSNRGHTVTGVDLDPDLLARARRRGPTINWALADLATLDLTNRDFDIIAMAGNVLPFVMDSDRAKVVGRLERHLSVGGLLIAGFTIDTKALAASGSGPPTTEDYLGWCTDANLSSREAWSSWDKAPLAADDSYRVFVHQK